MLWLVSDASLFPLAIMPLGPSPERLRMVTEYASLFANSLLWGVALYAAGSMIPRRARGKGG